MVDYSDDSLSLQVEGELLLESQVRQGESPRWVGRPVGWPAKERHSPWEGLGIQNPIRPVQCPSCPLLQGLDWLQTKWYRSQFCFPVQPLLCSSPHESRKPTSLSQMLQGLQVPTVAQAPGGGEFCSFL